MACLTVFFTNAKIQNKMETSKYILKVYKYINYV